MTDNTTIDDGSALVGKARIETFLLPQDVAARFRNSPSAILTVYVAYLLAGLFCFVYLVSTDFEHAQMYRFFGVVAFAFSFPLAHLLKKMFLGRSVTSVSDEVTSSLGQSEGFDKALREALMATPWSKARLHRGRYKKPLRDGILVLARSGENTSFSISPDCTSISVVVPENVFR